jgi:dienelactone hydrolase
VNHRLAAAFTFASLAACAVGDSQVAAPAQIRSTFRSGDVELAYVLDRPAGRGPHPAIVIGHGSGRVRKEDQGELAARFVGAGFAVLRYDKRGVGESGGVYLGVGTANSAQMIPLLAGDMAAAATHLRTLLDVDARHIGLAGASQAGWIIPVALTLAPAATFAVILSGPTVSVGLEIHYSELAEQGTMSPADAEARLASHRGPHGFDPLPYLEQLEVPVLWLFGADDHSIPTKLSVAILDRLVRASGKRFRWVVYPGVDHGLRGADIWGDIRPWLADHTATVPSSRNERLTRRTVSKASEIASSPAACSSSRKNRYVHGSPVGRDSSLLRLMPCAASGSRTRRRAPGTLSVVSTTTLRAGVPAVSVAGERAIARKRV